MGVTSPSSTSEWPGTERVFDLLVEVGASKPLFVRLFVDSGGRVRWQPLMVGSPVVPLDSHELGKIPERCRGLPFVKGLGKGGAVPFGGDDGTRRRKPLRGKEGATCVSDRYWKSLNSPHWLTKKSCGRAYYWKNSRSEP